MRTMQCRNGVLLLVATKRNLIQMKSHEMTAEFPDCDFTEAITLQEANTAQRRMPTLKVCERF